MKCAIVGITGAVGTRLLKILDERRFPCSEILGFSSPRSQGAVVKSPRHSVAARPLKAGCFHGVDVVFFDASDEVSREWVPQALSDGAWVIDNSAAFRMDHEVPLMVPEINGDLATQVASSRKLIAGPNCSTVQLVMALNPLHELWGLKRVIVSTYQSVSGAGTLAIDELYDGVRSALTGTYLNPPSPKVFKHPIAFNCIPQIGSFKTSGYTGEEEKIIEETRKILGLPKLNVNATSVRIPTLFGHGESVLAEFEKQPDPAQALEALKKMPGIRVLDSPNEYSFPTPLQADGGDDVLVGRMRADVSSDRGLSFWVVSDNLRKGAALNAVQIGETLLKAGLLA